MTCDRRLHKKLLEVCAEYLDGTVLGLFCKLVPDLPFNGRCDKPVVAVGDGGLQYICCIFVVSYDILFLQIPDDLIHRSFKLHSKEFLLLTSVDGKGSVTGHL